MTNRTGTIYTLTDPRDGAVRYIGKTTKPLLERLANHLASPTNPAMRVWINTLGGQGLTPHIAPLTTASAEDLTAEEERQIQRAAAAGHPLLNAPYYHRNIADLIPDRVRTPSRQRKARSRTGAQSDTYVHRIYGPIAAARAADTMPRWQAALRSLLLAPVVAVVLVWVPAVNSRLRKALFGLVLGTYYAWDIGFDRLIRDFVLAAVPTAEIAAFWHQYLAAPFQTAAWHLAGLLLAVGWLTYVQVAHAAGVASGPRPNAKSRTKEEAIAALAAQSLDSAIPNPRRATSLREQQTRAEP